MKTVVALTFTGFLFATNVNVAAAAPDGKSSKLPKEAQCYFDAVAAENLDALAGCFAKDAYIIDVDRRISGTAAIRKWAEKEVMGGRYEILEVRPGSASKGASAVEVLLTFAPRGNGGFRSRYEIVLAAGKLTSMILKYA
jgi:hypothetical protein